MERKDIHERILYPVTRVRAADSGGSGVLVYSEPDPQKPDQYINIALTCQHVVDKNIIVKDEWDAVLKRDVKKDIMQEVAVEIFDYDGSKIVSANSTSSGGFNVVKDPFEIIFFAVLFISLSEYPRTQQPTPTTEKSKYSFPRKSQILTPLAFE